MAYETDRYRQKALALLDEGLSYRGVASKLAEEHRRAVVCYQTVRRWHLLDRRHKQSEQQQQTAA